MNYHLMYNENGNTKLRSFRTIQERTEWVGAFTLSHLQNPTDNQVWLAFTGSIDLTADEFGCGSKEGQPTMIGQCRCEGCEYKAKQTIDISTTTVGSNLPVVNTASHQCEHPDCEGSKTIQCLDPKSPVRQPGCKCSECNWGEAA